MLFTWTRQNVKAVQSLPFSNKLYSSILSSAEFDLFLVASSQPYLIYFYFIKLDRVWWRFDMSGGINS